VRVGRGITGCGELGEEEQRGVRVRVEGHAGV